jgi:hypothetical protein
MANERLRTAMAAAQVGIQDVTRVTGTDPKTVQRWLGGRVPHPRNRWAVAQLLREEEGYLWPSTRPDLGPGADDAAAEVVAAYGHRADVPTQVWTELLDGARRQIDLLGYALLFLPEQHVDLVRTIKKTCAGGKVRIMLANPDGARIRERDSLEQLGGTLPARIRMTLALLKEIRGLPGVEIRLHDVHLYNAVYRFDDEMIVTPHLVGAHGFQHPALHLRRLGPYGIFASFADQLETLWTQASPMDALGSGLSA